MNGRALGVQAGNQGKPGMRHQPFNMASAAEPDSIMVSRTVTASPFHIRSRSNINSIVLALRPHGRPQVNA